MKIKKLIHIPMRVPLPDDDPHTTPMPSVNRSRFIFVSELVDSLQRVEPTVPPDAHIEFVPGDTGIAILSGPRLAVVWEEDLPAATT